MFTRDGVKVGLFGLIVEVTEKSILVSVAVGDVFVESHPPQATKIDSAIAKNKSVPTLSSLLIILPPRKLLVDYRLNWINSILPNA